MQDVRMGDDAREMASGHVDWNTPVWRPHSPTLRWPTSAELSRPPASTVEEDPSLDDSEMIDAIAYWHAGWYGNRFAPGFGVDSPTLVRRNPSELGPLASTAEEDASLHDREIMDATAYWHLDWWYANRFASGLRSISPTSTRRPSTDPWLSAFPVEEDPSVDERRMAQDIGATVATPDEVVTLRQASLRVLLRDPAWQAALRQDPVPGPRQSGEVESPPMTGERARSIVARYIRIVVPEATLVSLISAHASAATPPAVVVTPPSDGEGRLSGTGDQAGATVAPWT